MEKVVLGSQVFAWQNIGGISRYMVELARGLHRGRDFSPILVGGFHSNGHLREIEDPSLPVWGFDVPWLSKGKQQLNLHFDRLALLLNRPSVYHTSYYRPLPPRLDIPLILTVYDCLHEECPEEEDPTGERAKVKVEALHRADEIICISDTTRNSLLKHYDLDPDICQTVYLGVEPITIHSPKVFEGDYILYVGHRPSYKRLDTLYAAFSAVMDELPEWKILLVGGNPPDETERNRYAELGISGRVHHRNFGESELRAAYQHAGMLVFPSSYEGFGLPVLEAMVQGCPVIVSSGGALPEIAGDAGLVFPVGDEQVLARHIREVALSPGKRDVLKHACLQRAAEFTWDRCARETASVYRKAIAKFHSH